MAEAMPLTLDQLVPLLAERLSHAARPSIIGVSGGQGAGKTTLCAALETYLEQNMQCESLTLALDDFYLGAEQRAALAAKVSPLAKTRGVPGTHHVQALYDCLTTLTSSQDKGIYLPRFSKADDTQVEPLFYAGRPAIIFLEGWCIGAQAAFLAGRPQTEWEKERDPNQVWRQWSAEEVKAYYPIWGLLDQLILIRQESFAAVIDSRWTQEQSNAASSGKWQFTSREEVAEFCAHYETWTEALWEHLPRSADLTIWRDQSFQYSIAV
jgi:D-glycerate 3-kinase